MIVKSGIQPAAIQRKTVKTLEHAIQDHRWVSFQYDDKDVTFIPSKLDGSLLKGVRATDSEFRSYSLGKMEGLKELPKEKAINPRTNDGIIGELKEAIEAAPHAQVDISYQLPNRPNPITLTIDPEGFVRQPDKSLAVEALAGQDQAHPRHFRLDRIIAVEPHVEQ